MPIRVTVEVPDTIDPIVYKRDVAIKGNFLIPTYADGAQQALHIESFPNDLGGSVAIKPGSVEDVDGGPKPELKDELDKILDTTSPDYVQIPIAGAVVREIVTRKGRRATVKAAHVGHLALLCHPNTRLPLFDGQLSGNHDVWDYDPFIICSD